MIIEIFYDILYHEKIVFGDNSLVANLDDYYCLDLDGGLNWEKQNSYNYFWEEKDVHKRLDAIMTKAFKDVLFQSTEKNVHMRTAAYLVAVSRVAEAMKLRGWV